MTAEYKKWLLLATGEDVRQVRINKMLVELQEQAIVVRRAEVMRRLAKIRLKAHKQMPHIQIHVPGVNDSDT